MLFVATLTLKEGLPREKIEEAFRRHASWQHPEGWKVVGDYFLNGTPQVIIIFEAEEVSPIFAMNLAWADLFDINVFPAMPLEEALKEGGRLMASESISHA